MFDLKLIREDPDAVREGLAAKNITLDLENLQRLDERRRQVLTELDDLRASKNRANDEISRLIKEKKDPKPSIAAMKETAARIDELEAGAKAVEGELQEILIGIPNLPLPDVPVGGAEANRTVREWGRPPEFDFQPRTHIELAESLDIIDFKRAAKISGSNFILYKGAGARLERALINFMLDLHTGEHGYREIFPPFLVNPASMTGTGQLPKMKEDMYRLADDDLYLIPTAEVPVTNIHRDETLAAEDLPVTYAGYSACFRREAGSYGKDTRGMTRVHQFDKVELVRFVRPETSADELEKLVGHAETVLQRLDLPYRVLLLASGDLSFAAAKCYDLEAYAAGGESWLEVSSCSTFGDFQARRARIRYRSRAEKTSGLVHTLNGSGLALARTMIAILENYQTAAGEVTIPEALWPYMGGMTRISPPAG